jgi:glycosyltransferase involved in cell wall biosynthesis
MKLVSILMPAYNVEKYIYKAINSILIQTYKNFELLIVDDASIDNTVQIVESFSDYRIKLVKNPKNIGVAANRNLLLELASGDYIAFFDSDDISSNHRIEKQVNFLNSHKLIDVLGSRVQYIDELEKNILFRRSDNFFTHSEISSELLFNNVLCTSTIIFRSKYKHLLQNHFVFDIAEDYYLWAILFINKCNFACLDEKLVKYRVRNSGSTKTYLSKLKLSFDKIHSIMLNHLNIMSTSDILDIHNGPFIPNCEFNIELLEKSDFLYTQILENNSIHKIFSNGHLFKSIEKNWYLKCRMSIKHIGLEGVRIYCKSDFKKFRYIFFLITYYYFDNSRKFLKYLTNEN